MKNKGLIITLIVILSTFVIGLVVGLVLLLRNGDMINFNFNLGNKKMNLIDSYEALPFEVNKIYLNLYSTDVEIKESTNGDVLVEYYSNRNNNAKVEFVDNIIKVDESEYDVSCFGICNTRRKVVIYVPNTYKGLFDLNTRSGDISSKTDLSNNSIEVETSSGDVYFSQTGVITISTKSGDIKINKVFKDGTLSSLSGDIVLDEVLKRIIISTSSGDVRIDKLEIVTNSSISTSSGDVYISNNKSNCYVETKTSSGDALINKSNRKSDLVLKINTSSGDIIVK